MADKAKKRHPAMNEEVDSDIADHEDDMADETLPKRGKKAGGLNDPFFI